MMRNIILGILIFIVGVVAITTNSLASSTQAGTGEWMTSLDFVGENHGWVVGNAGLIVHTSNGGESWQAQTSGTAQDLYEVDFVDVNNGWAVGDAGTILHTGDGGTNWQSQTISLTVPLNGLFFLNDQTGWTGYPGGVFKSTDGGVTWRKTGSGISLPVRAIHFLDANNGFLVATDLGINFAVMSTTDGGETWTRVTGIPPKRYRDVYFVDATFGVLLDELGDSLYTDDGGNSWQQGAWSGSTIGLSAVHFFDADHGWAVGHESARSHEMLRTEDGGKNWIKSNTDGGTDVWFVTLDKGFIVDRNEILVSTTSGITWSAIFATNGTPSPTPTSNPLWMNKLDFVGQDHGWVVGNHGRILNTTDSGQSWQEQTSGTTQDLYEVDFVDVNNGWAVGDAGTILHTGNGGTNWQSQTISLTVPLNGLFFLNDQTGWTGYPGGVFKTTDGGVTWRRTGSGIYLPVRAIHFLDANNGFLVATDLGINFAVMSTTDGGETWTRVTGIPPKRYRDVYFVDATFGVLLDELGDSLYTDDGGNSWQQGAWSGSTIGLSAVHFFDADHGWAVGHESARSHEMLRTEDGGKNWIKSNTDGGTDVWFVTLDKGFIVDRNEILLSTTSGIIWSVIYITNDLPPITVTLTPDITPTDTLTPTHTPSATPTATSSRTPIPTNTVPNDVLSEIFPQRGQGASFSFFTNNSNSDFSFESADNACVHTAEHGLKFAYSIKEKDFAGWGVVWKDSSPGYLDASGFDRLEFWAKGFKGNETFRVALIDSHQNEDEVIADEYTNTPKGANWTKIVIPLNAFAGVDLSRLTHLQMVTLYALHGAGTICIDDIALVPPTATPSATPTRDPSEPGDDYEANDSCANASAIEADGAIQEHTFHDEGDVDWVRFNAIAGTTYRIEATIPDNSPADLILEIYANCDSLPTERWDERFTPGVRFDFPATATGPIYLRLANQKSAVGGTNVRYQLTVRALPAESKTGALVLVAGRLGPADALQDNIHNVTNRVHAIFQAQGYIEEDIYYLATNTGLPGYDAAATKENLHNAITQWAAERVGDGKPFTLYMMDHGDEETFYLDDSKQQIVTPDELDDWLSTLETKAPGTIINVIIEACHAGSFVGRPQTISKPGRLIITSSNVTWDAYASREGAYFSDYFLTGLQQGRNLFSSFWETHEYIKRLFSLQQPWLDADGDGVANTAGDFAIAANRGFAYAGTLSDDAWPPYIATVSEPVTIIAPQGMITATVFDDQAVDSVWAVVYSPSYVPAASDQELTPELLPTLLLTARGDDQYVALYTGFTEIGTYRIVIHAKDRSGNLARPVEMTLKVGHQLYLPLIHR